MFLKQKSQNIDRMIQSIKAVQMNRCSLSDEDLKLLDEVINLLEKQKTKWDKTDMAALLVVIKVAEILSRFFEK